MPSIPQFHRIALVLTLLLAVLGGRRSFGAVSDGFDYPVGKPYRSQAHDGDGWYAALDFNERYAGGYAWGEDWNAEGNNAFADCGQPAYAISNGTVYRSGWTTWWGNYIIVRHELPAGGYVESFYGRLSQIMRSSGDVSRGEQIGKIGDTGNTGGVAGCRLHFEIRDPSSSYYGSPTLQGVSGTSRPKGFLDPSAWIDSHRPPLAAGAIGKPTLLSPANAATISTYTPPASRFTWIAASGATGYDIEFDDDPGFVSPSKYTSASTQFDLPGPLTPLGNYYWRVRGTNGAQKGPYSTQNWKVNLSTSLPGPILDEPDEGDSLGAGAVLFDWDPVAASNGYRLQVASDPAFSDLEHNQVVPAGTSQSVPGLSNGLHYWRVLSRTAGGVDAGVSLTRSFTISDPNAPVPPTLASPADGAVIATCEQTFAWNPSSGATSYKIQISTSSSFGSILQSATTSQLSAAFALGGGTFYWRVQAIKSGSASLWSAPVRRVTLNASSAPAAPALVSPPPNPTQSSITFFWTPNGASSYDLQVLNSSGSTTYVNQAGLNGSSFTPSFAFSPGNYQWRMRSRQGSQIGCWGSSTTFTVTLPPVPGAPTPLLPTLGLDTQNPNGSVAFTWTPQGPAASKFEVWVLNKDGSKHSARTTSNATPSTTISNIPPGSYDWMVRGFNALNNPGNWSAQTAFRVKAPGETGLGKDPYGMPMVSDPVNSVTGNYTFHRTDILVPAVGFPFEFSRTYNSKDSRLSGALGAKWTHSFETRLEIVDPTTVRIVMSDGNTLFFAYDSASSTYTQLYVPSTGSLVAMPFGHRFTTKRLMRYDFDAAGKLSAVSDRNGNTLTLTYDAGTGYLSQIADTSGRIYVLTSDPSGRITQISDPLGRIVAYGYDVQSDLVSVTNPRAQTTLYEYTAHNMTKVTDARGNFLVRNVYDAQGRVVSQRNARNFTTTFAYDDANDFTTVTDALGKTEKYEYDLNLRVLAVTGKRGYVTRFEYDAAGNRIAVTDPLGRSTRFTYDSSGNVLTATNAKDEKTSMTWTASNQISAIQDPLNRVTRFTYDSRSNLVGISAPMGANTTMDRDARGLVVRSVNPRGAVTQFTYDAAAGRIGDLRQTADALNRLTDYEYDAVGRLLKITEPGDTVPERAVTQFAYDPNDNLTDVTDGLGKTASFHFDANDNLTSSTTRRGNIWRTAYNEHDMPSVKTDPLNSAIQYVYDELDRVSQMIDQRGKTWSFTYDPEGRLLTSSDPTSSTLTRAYDPAGNLTSITNANGHETRFAYDPLNRLASTTNPLFDASRIEYDAAGRISKLIDAMDRETLLEYDGLDRMVKVTDAAMGTVEYGYDAVGNRTSVRDPRGSVSIFIYDLLNRLTKVIDPLNRSTQYTYDTPGNRKTRLDARAILTTYAYDLNHRLTGINYSDSTPDVSPIAYDDDGNRLSAAVAGLGTQSYAYDPIGRLDSYTDVFGRALDYDYDPASNRTRIVYPGALNVDYAYDDAGRLDTVTDWAAGVLDYDYDAAGNLVQTAYPNGATETRAYDAAERVAQIHHLNASGGTLAKMDFIYDDVGNIIVIDREDAALRKFAQEHTDYGYDAANQMLQSAGETQQFDAAGNQTRVRRADGTQLDLTYDAENRVTSIYGPSGTANLSYDANGLRIRSIAGAATTRHLWDVNSGLPMPVVEDDGTNPVARDLYGLMGYARRAAPTNAVQALHADQVGTVLAVTNDAGGLAFGAAYDEFGERTGSNGTPVNAYGFWGAYGVPVEKEALLYARARFLDPTTGRFLGKDPISNFGIHSQKSHRFINALNNPLSWIDATGASPTEVGRRQGSLRLADGNLNMDYVRQLPKDVRTKILKLEMERQKMQADHYTDMARYYGRLQGSIKDYAWASVTLLPNIASISGWKSFGKSTLLAFDAANDSHLIERAFDDPGFKAIENVLDWGLIVKDVTELPDKIEDLKALAIEDSGNIDWKYLATKAKIFNSNTPSDIYGDAFSIIAIDAPDHFFNKFGN